MNTMDKMLLILLITVLAFVCTVIYFNFNDKQVHDSLINMFLGMCATELVAMGGIKAFKIKNGKRSVKTRKKKNTEDNRNE